MSTALFFLGLLGMMTGFGILSVLIVIVGINPYLGGSLGYPTACSVVLIVVGYFTMWWSEE